MNPVTDEVLMEYILITKKIPDPTKSKLMKATKTFAAEHDVDYKELLRRMNSELSLSETVSTPSP